MLHSTIARRPVPYENRLEERDREIVTLLVVHCTELPDLATAREYAELIHYPGSRTGNCGHFYVDRDGTTEAWVPIERVAHHVAGMNARSVGVELVNRGRYPHWHHSDHQAFEEPYPEAQLEALTRLTAELRRVLPALTDVAGHEHLDQRWIPAADDPAKKVRRKLDPGPAFPWDRFLAASGLRFRPDQA